MRFTATFQSINQNAKRLLLVSLAVAMSFVPLVLSTSTAQAASTATLLYEKTIDSRTLELYIYSPLTGAPVKSVRLIVPDGWSKKSANKYPALWLLHGGLDTYESWMKNTTIKDMVNQHQVVVVMPDTSWCSSYTDWLDPTGPQWETYLTSQLRDLLSNSYAVDGTNAAVAGISMGGLGSMKLAEQHPDMFKAVASFSGNVDPLHAYNGSVDGPDLPGLACASDWRRVWGDYNTPAQRTVWERNDPYMQADKLAQMKYVYISAGDGITDPLNKNMFFFGDPVEKQVRAQADGLSNKLKGLNIPAETNFTVGTHTWPYWQKNLQQALPGLLNAINVQ